MCPDEFRRGVTCFMDALNEGAPFAAAFTNIQVVVGAADAPDPVRCAQ